MPSIVDHDVHRTYFLFEAAPKLTVGLVSDEYTNGIVLVGFAGSLNVDADNSAFFPKIIAPHIETAAAVDANLDNDDFTASKASEMPVIYLEIVIPFINSIPSAMCLEVFMQLVCSYIGVFLLIGASWPLNAIAP